MPVDFFDTVPARVRSTLRNDDEHTIFLVVMFTIKICILFQYSAILR